MEQSTTITKIFRALQFRKHVKGKEYLIFIRKKETKFGNCSISDIYSLGYII